MKKIGMIFWVLFLAVAVTACDVSVSPKDGETIVMNPGNIKEIVVNTSGLTGSKWTHTFSIRPDSDETDVPTFYRTSYVNKSDGTSVDTMTLLPNEEMTGRFIVEFRVHGPEPPSLLESKTEADNIHDWYLLVQGVSISPRQDISAPQGTTMIYTATAYPEGDYQYQWLLDESPVGAGKTFEFIPNFSQCGKHTLTAVATGAGTTFRHTRDIFVPLVKIEGVYGNAIHTTPDGGFIVNGENGRIVKLDISGQVEWQKHYYPDKSASIKPSGDGGYIMAGYTDTYNSTANYVQKLDSQGEVVWKYIYDTPSDYAMVVEPTLDGGYIAAGNMIVKLNSTGVEEWRNTDYSGQSVRQTSDGGWVIFGKKNQDACMVILDSNGVDEWYRPIDPDYVYDGDIIPDDTGGYMAIVNRNDFVNKTYQNLLINLAEDITINWEKQLNPEAPAHLYAFHTLLKTSLGVYWAIGRTEPEWLNPSSYNLTLPDDDISTLGSLGGCLFRWDSNGNALNESTNLIGGMLENHHVLDATLTSDGGCVFIDVINYYNTSSTYVIKLDGNGN